MTYFVILGDAVPNVWHYVNASAKNYVGDSIDEITLTIDGVEMWHSSTQTMLSNAGYIEACVQSGSHYQNWTGFEIDGDAWVVSRDVSDMTYWVQNDDIPDTYTLSNEIVNPTNTTYNSVSVPVQLTVSGNDTNIVTTFNTKFSDGTWLYGTNQTYTTATTMTIPTNETNVLFCALSEGDHEKAYTEVYFSVNITPQPSIIGLATIGAIAATVGAIAATIGIAIYKKKKKGL
jgi:hypothetical protein